MDPDKGTVDPGADLMDPDKEMRKRRTKFAVSKGMELYNLLWRNIKYLSLLVLVGQNTALVLTMRYSRITHGDKLYLASTVVFLTEIVKFAVCVMVVGYNNNFDISKVANIFHVEIISKAHETAKLSLPSILYTVQNNLLFIALSHLNAATFQVDTTFWQMLHSKKYSEKHYYNILTLM